MIDFTSRKSRPMTIKQEIIKGAFWTGVAKYSGIVISLVISAILARLISPSEFGTVAIVTVILNFMSMFATMGIFPAIIQRNDLTQGNLNSIFTFSLISGATAMFILIGMSWSVADFYGDQTLIYICWLLSINLFFTAANLVPNALMSKNKRFKEIAIRTLILQIISGIISVAAAFAGFGVYALVISPIFSSIGILIYNMRFYPCRIDCKMDMRPVKSIFNFSAFELMFEFVNYFSRNLDKLIIGKFLNMSALGYYDKSYRLMLLPMQNITSVINPVLQPVLTSLQNDGRQMAKKYNKLIHFIATLGFPLAIILYFNAYEMINIVYGNRWDAAIPTFKILALSIPFQLILSTSGAIFLSMGDVKRQFWVGIRNTVTTVAGFLIAAIFFPTIEAMAWAWTITLLINFACSFFIMYRYSLQSSLWAMIKELRLSMVSALILSVALMSIQNLISEYNIVVKLIIKVSISIIFSLAFVQITKQYDIISKIKQIKSKYVRH